MYSHALPYRYVLGTRVDAATCAGAASVVLHWARTKQSKFVCPADVSLVMTAHDDGLFRRVVNSADLVISDGLRLAWTLRAFGIDCAMPVRASDLLARVCELAAHERIPIGLLIDDARRANALRSRLESMHPGLHIVYTERLAHSSMTAREDERQIARINDSGARILLVGGERRNEKRWMVEHKGRVKCVMLGLGRSLDAIPAIEHQSGAPKAPRDFDIKANVRFVTLVVLQWLGLRPTWS